MTVVSDSTTLISLAKIGQFELLRDLFTEIIIPASVYEEVVNKGKGRDGGEFTLLDREAYLTGQASNRVQVAHKRRLKPAATSCTYIPQALSLRECLIKV